MEIRAVDDVMIHDVDDETLAALAAEDFEAFAELYRRYECVVFRVVRSRSPSDDVAEDITAHVFFKALQKSGGVARRGQLPVVAVRDRPERAVSTWRSQKGRNAVVLEAVPDLEDPVPSPPAQVVIGEERDLIWRRVS